jgi:hypothetical protein
MILKVLTLLMIFYKINTVQLPPIMNCFRYSLPVSPKLLQFLKPLPESISRPFAPDRIPCQEILAPAARRLIEPETGGRLASHDAALISFVLNWLSQDERVRSSLGEYYGLRLLVSELANATADFEDNQMPGRFQRVARKLLRELNQPSSVIEATGLNQFSGPALVQAAV